MSKSKKEKPQSRQCYRRPQSNSGQWRKTQFPLHIKTICLTDCWILIGLYFMIILTYAVYVWVQVVLVQCSWHHFVAKCVNKVACALTFICVINPHETKCARKNTKIYVPQLSCTEVRLEMPETQPGRKTTNLCSCWTIFQWCSFISPMVLYDNLTKIFELVWNHAEI